MRPAQPMTPAHPMTPGHRRWPAHRTGDAAHGRPTPPVLAARDRRSWRRAIASGLALLVVVGAAGCGELTLDEQPRVIDSSNVPEALLGPTSTVAPGAQPPDQGVDAELFFYLTTDSDEFLVPCLVPTAAGGSVEARTRAVLERLINLDPVTSDECVSGVTNAVPSNLVIRGVELRVEESGNVLELDLGKDALSSIESTQQRRAIAQLVFTATAVPGVSAVRFLGDGELISVPVEDRTADPGDALRPADFPRLVAALDRLTALLTPPTTLRDIDTQPVL